MNFQQRSSLHQVTVHVIPSKPVMKQMPLVCTEKQIRLGTQMNKVNQKMSMLKIQTAVLALRLDVCTAKHSIETQHGLDNHNTSLIRMLVSVYVNIRQHHVVRLHNEKVEGPSVKTQLDKNNHV